MPARPRSSPFRARRLAPLGASLVLGACALTRVAPPPPVAPPAQFKEAGAWQTAAPEAAVPDRWWTLFQDSQLDALEQRLVIGNENLKAAAAQVASARAVVTASRAALAPTLSVGLAGTRSASPGGTAGSGANPANSVSLSASAGWELDLWGRLAQASEGARASLQASADDLAAARLSAQALLVQTYFSLRTADCELALLERSVLADQRALELTQARYDAGVAARTDVLQAQTQLHSVQAQMADWKAQRAQLEHAIASLLGEPAARFALARDARLPEVPAVPELLPATLLQRRPDIAAAERRMAAAALQAGQARAAFFPALSLSANAGWRHTSLSQLVSAPNLFWSLGPSLAEAVLDGGQRRLASAQALAALDQAGASYRQTVLAALQEVEDNLVLAMQLQDESQSQAQALLAAQRALEITLDQYRAGTVSYLGVVSAQASALNAEATLLAVRNRQLAAVNALLKNIAGRWTPA